VSHILPISSGNGKPFTTLREDGTENTRKAITPRGQYHITRKVNGWRKSELGMLYYPLYYRGGAAVHGANSVPSYPASHGCIRIPMFAAAQFSSMTPVGFPILVY
jgi:N-acetylmuramoyl-L-alanine amidase